MGGCGCCSTGGTSCTCRRTPGTRRGARPGRAACARSACPAEGWRSGPDRLCSMRVVVVGGGIAGLAAALRLRDELGAAARITVLDQAGRLGGKLRTEAFGDGYSEAGAEAFVVTDPAAIELAGRVGLGDALRHPATGRAALAIAGELVPIPAGTLMGVPAD